MLQYFLFDCIQCRTSNKSIDNNLSILDMATVKKSEKCLIDKWISRRNDKCLHSFGVKVTWCFPVFCKLLFILIEVYCLEESMVFMTILFKREFYCSSQVLFKKNQTFHWSDDFVVFCLMPVRNWNLKWIILLKYTNFNCNSIPWGV